MKFSVGGRDRRERGREEERERRKKEEMGSDWRGGEEREAGWPGRWEEKKKNVDSQKPFFKQKGIINSQPRPGGQIKKEL